MSDVGNADRPLVVGRSVHAHLTFDHDEDLGVDTSGCHQNVTGHGVDRLAVRGHRLESRCVDVAEQFELGELRWLRRFGAGRLEISRYSLAERLLDEVEVKFRELYDFNAVERVTWRRCGVCHESLECFCLYKDK